MINFVFLTSSILSTSSCPMDSGKSLNEQWVNRRNLSDRGRDLMLQSPISLLPPMNSVRSLLSLCKEAGTVAIGFSLMFSHVKPASFHTTRGEVRNLFPDISSILKDVNILSDAGRSDSLQSRRRRFLSPSGNRFEDGRTSNGLCERSSSDRPLIV